LKDFVILQTIISLFQHENKTILGKSSCIFKIKEYFLKLRSSTLIQWPSIALFLALVVNMSHSHKSGSLKQKNKEHKGSGSKREQKRGFGAGKVSNAARKGQRSTSDMAVERRINRMNKKAQLTKNKKQEMWLEKRLGTKQGPPKIVGIIPISAQSNAQSTLLSLLHSASWSSAGVDTSNQAILDTLPTSVHAIYDNYRMKCTYITARDRELMSVMDIAKVADVLMIVVHCSDDWEIDMFDGKADELISVLKAVGMPEVVCCLQGMETVSHRKYKDIKRDVLRNIDSTIVPDIKSFEVRAIVGDTGMEKAGVEMEEMTGFGTQNKGYQCGQMLHALSGLTARTVQWRSIRSYMCVDTVRSTMREGERVITIEGFLRGQPMPVNSLMHIPGAGASRITSVTASTSPFDTAKCGEKYLSIPSVDVMNGTVVYANKGKQDSLDMAAEPDGLMGEQTWPTAEELLLAGSAMDGSGGDRSQGRERRGTDRAVDVPVGMSDYQADWFIDEDGKFETNSDDDGGDREELETRVVGGAAVRLHDTEGDDMTVGGSVMDEPDHRAFDIAEKKELARHRAAEAAEHQEFPDEMDTPLEVAARQRFARYRALQSFRASEWHPKENLPQDYSTIFQFANFATTQKEILIGTKKSLNAQQNQHLLHFRGEKSGISLDNTTVGNVMAISNGDMDFPSTGEAENGSHNPNNDDISIEGATMTTCMTGGGDSRFLVPQTDDIVQSGQYVRIELADGAVEDLDESRLADLIASNSFLTAFSLLPHENKISVLHFNINRCDDPSDYVEDSEDGNAMEGARCDEERIIRSKDNLIFHAGFRTFQGRPIFSESNLNCDKHKFERFLVPDRFAVASVYGPVSFMPCPVLVFRQEGDIRKLVATGTLGSVDPDRIMLKRVILTGYPMRIKKKFAVVKHMFYQANDVRWFRPAELATKHGLRGNIRESLGNKGLFKAIFSGPIKQNDTVMLVLYKRVYPKFPSDRTVL